MTRKFVFVDGESHFSRSLCALRNLHGPNALLQHLRFKHDHDDRLMLVDSKAKIFWTKRMSPGAVRTSYFTALVGDDPTQHDVRLKLRNFELEPCLTEERADQAARRQNELDEHWFIEKAKGVDISLAVQMVHGAFQRNFEVCHLYTSDADFLPAIRSVRTAGINVFVFGFKNGIGKRSLLLTEPDQFIDLERVLAEEFEYVPSVEGD